MVMDQWKAAAAKARSQLGVVTHDQLRGELGISRSAIAWAVERGRLERMFERAYRFHEATNDVHQQALAATLLAGDGSALSHQTAGALFRLAGIGPATSSRIHLSVPHRRTLSLPPHFIVHRPIHPFLLFRQHGLPTTSITRTLIDLASVLDEEALEIALDDAHHRFKVLGDRLEATLNRLDPRYPGLGALRELVRARRGRRTDSPLEVRVWRVLRKAGLDPARVQFEVFADGEYVMRIDFAWPEHKVALHVDSYRWHARRAAFDADARQRTRLAALGWANLTVTSQTLHESAWLDDLRRLLHERAPQLTLAI